MLVTADEWMLLTSRQSVKAGRLQIQLYDRGEDAHDVAARRVDRLGRRVGRTFRIRETRPGELAEATWRLRSGEVQALVHPAGTRVRRDASRSAGAVARQLHAGWS